METKIIDPNTAETVPIGTIGEFCTRGYHVMLGYFEMPEASAAAIDADGWLHTGDLCAMDARGYCTVEGRLKDMIIRGGENIYPRELEELLFRHPKVGEVAVVGVPHEKWGEEVAAFIRPVSGAVIDKEEMTAYMRASLAPHKSPKHWVVVEAFPLTGSGKIQKSSCVKPGSRERWRRSSRLSEVRQGPDFPFSANEIPRQCFTLKSVWGGGGRSISGKVSPANRSHSHSQFFFCSTHISSACRLIASWHPTWRSRKPSLHRILTKLPYPGGRRQPRTAEYLFSVSSQPCLKKCREIRRGVVRGPLLSVKATTIMVSVDVRS